MVVPLFLSKGGNIIKFEELADVKSESGVVASLIAEPNFLNFIENLKGDDFTDRANGVIYDAICRLKEQEIQQIDAFNINTSISGDAKLQKRAEGCLSPDIIAQIVDNAKFLARGTSEEFVLCVNNVLAMAYKRKLYRDLNAAQTRVLSAKSITDIQRDVSDILDSAADNYINGADIPKIGDQLDEIIQKIESKQGVNRGYEFKCVKKLNDYVTIDKNEMLTFLAPMKSGKSIMLMNTAIDVMEQGAKCIFLDSEMTDALFTQRLIAYYSQVPVQHIRRGNYDDDERRRVEKAIEIIKGLELYHKYIPIYTTDEIYGYVKTMKRKYGCDVLFFDYLKPSNSTDAFSTYAELGNLTNTLKNRIAGDLDIAVVSACQASRNGGIADSVRIAQYSSAVIKMERKDYADFKAAEEYGNYKFTVLYNRLGEQMQEGEQWIDANFYGNYAQFQNCKQHMQEDIYGEIPQDVVNNNNKEKENNG